MKKEHITAAVLLGAFGVGFLGCMLYPDQEWSLSERRRLAQKPVASLQTVMDGKFMKDFESYTLDQFPLRDIFRNLKAQVQYHIMQQKDNNGIYLVDGSLSKLETKLEEKSVENAADKFNALQEKYFPDSSVYYGVIPDKNYYLAQKAGYPHIDYEKLDAILAEKLTDMEHIDLYDCLGAENYYKTDSHWRQETLEKTANRIAEHLGVTVTAFEEYDQTVYDQFHGVYWGQSALPLPAEDLVYLSSDILDACTVHHFETGKDTSIYESEKLQGKDAYDVFLGGADALLTITNPNAATDRELILFRDSFGSSLAPLLVQDYASVTLVDLRYISSTILDQFIDFYGQDVLFLYSPSVYNNSAMLK